MGLSLKKFVKGVGKVAKKVGKTGVGKAVTKLIKKTPAGTALAIGGTVLAAGATALQKKKQAKKVEKAIQQGERLPPGLGGLGGGDLGGIPEEYGQEIMEAGFSGPMGRIIGPGIGGALIGEGIERFAGGGGSRMPQMNRGTTALMIASGALPVATGAEKVTCLKCPKGYVKVELPQQGAGRLMPGATRTLCVLKQIAYESGLAKRPRRGGGISSSQIRAARHVNTVIQSLTVKRTPKVQLRKARRK